jgi:hypothetical protein
MVSLLTALIIQRNDVSVFPYEDDSKKWGYELGHMERGNYRALVTCEAVYSSGEEAKRNGEELVGSIREMYLMKSNHFFAKS